LDARFGKITLTVRRGRWDSQDQQPTDGFELLAVYQNDDALSLIILTWLLCFPLAMLDS
jgi:hypothetical protein